METSTIGSINESKNCSTKAINSKIEAFATAPLEMFPFITYNAPIIGKNPFIMPQRVLIYPLVVLAKLVHTEKEVRHAQSAEVIENVPFKRSDCNEP